MQLANLYLLYSYNLAKFIYGRVFLWSRVTQFSVLMCKVLRLFIELRPHRILLDIELCPEFIFDFLPHISQLSLHPVPYLKKLLLELHPQTLFLHCPSLEYLLFLHNLLKLFLKDFCLLFQLPFFLQRRCFDLVCSSAPIPRVPKLCYYLFIVNLRLILLFWRKLWKIFCCSLWVCHRFEYAEGFMRFDIVLAITFLRLFDKAWLYFGRLNQ